MSGPKEEDLREKTLASSEARAVDLAQLQLQIRRSRQELMDSLNSLPDALAEKKILEETASKTAEKKDSLLLPLSVRKQDQRVLFQTATKEVVRKEVPGSVRMSNSQEIEQVLYGDVSHPRSLSPDELPRQTTAVTQIRRNRDISQSMIIPRANRNSLTPTKITFCYQSKPTDTVAYVTNRQQNLSQRRGGHLKESFVKEVIERRASPVDGRTSNPVIVRTISTPINSIIRTTTVNTRPVDSQFASIGSSSIERHRKEAAISCKFEALGQRCNLCELTRSNLKGFRETRYSNVVKTLPEDIQKVDSDMIVPEGESHADAINVSPGKESTKGYLSSEVKQQFRNSYEGTGVRRSRRQIFGGDFMSGMESRSKAIQSELTKLNQSITQTPVRALTVPDQSSLKIRESTHTRKKIFPQKKVGKSNTYIRIDENEKQPGRLTSAVPVKSISYIQGPPKERTYSQIHSHLRNLSPLVVNQRNVSVSPTFRNTVATTVPVHYSNVIFRPPAQGKRVVTVSHAQPAQSAIRTVSPAHNEQRFSTAPIIIERIVTPTRKDRTPPGAQETEAGRLQYGLMSERNQFFKKDAEVVTSKMVKIPDFQLTDMSTEVRSWFQSHKREIDYQSQRICSYDLIKRYMSDPEISVRLHKLIGSQVDPKRWLLTMVDEVYAELKDRYLPIHK